VVHVSAFIFQGSLDGAAVGAAVLGPLLGLGLQYATGFVFALDVSVYSMRGEMRKL
jgi:hypothetical protein